MKVTAKDNAWSAEEYAYELNGPADATQVADEIEAAVAGSRFKRVAVGQDMQGAVTCYPKNGKWYCVVRIYDRDATDRFGQPIRKPLVMPTSTQIRLALGARWKADA